MCKVMEKYEQKAAAGIEEGVSLMEKAITMLAAGKTPYGCTSKHCRSCCAIKTKVESW